MTPEERRVYDRKWYAKHKKRIHSKKRFQNLSWQKALRDWMRRMKQSPCKDCGQKFPPECMQFDHVRGCKKASIADLVSSSVAKEMILREIEKCELVCANCHAIRTAKNFGK